MKSDLTNLILNFPIKLKIHNVDSLKVFLAEFFADQTVKREIIKFIFNDSEINYDFLLETLTNFIHKSELHQEVILNTDKTQYAFFEFFTELKDQIVKYLSIDQKWSIFRIEGKKHLDNREYETFLRSSLLSAKHIIIFGLRPLNDNESFKVNIEDGIITDMDVSTLSDDAIRDRTILKDKSLEFKNIQSVSYKDIAFKFGKSGYFHNFILIGRAGMGKSTLLKYITISRITNLLEQKNHSNNKKEFVVFFPLKGLNENLSIFDSILLKCQETRSLPIEFFNYWHNRQIEEFLISYRLILLLDAVDEIRNTNSYDIFTSNFRILVDKINRLELNSEISIFVSSRPEIFKDFFEIFLSPNLVVYNLLGFNDEQALVYVTKWYKEIENKDDVFAKTFFEKMQTNYEDLPNKKEIISSPLLLSMLSIYYLQYNNFPPSKIKLFEYIPEFLCFNWDENRKIKSSYEVFDKRFELIERFFSIIAYNHTKGVNSNLNNDKMEFKSNLEEFKKLSNSEAEYFYREIIRAINARPVIGSFVQDKFLFNLNSILEYYAALRATIIIIDAKPPIQDYWNIISPLFKHYSQSGEMLIYLLYDKVAGLFDNLINLFFMKLVETPTIDFYDTNQTFIINFFEETSRFLINNESYELPIYKLEILSKYCVKKHPISKSKLYQEKKVFYQIFQTEEFWLDVFKSYIEDESLYEQEVIYPKLDTNMQYFTKDLLPDNVGISFDMAFIDILHNFLTISPEFDQEKMFSAIFDNLNLSNVKRNENIMVVLTFIYNYCSDDVFNSIINKVQEILVPERDFATDMEKLIEFFGQKGVHQLFMNTNFGLYYYFMQKVEKFSPYGTRLDEVINTFNGQKEILLQFLKERYSWEVGKGEPLFLP